VERHEVLRLHLRDKEQESHMVREIQAHTNKGDGREMQALRRQGKHAQAFPEKEEA
jgi:hypothetical protein